MTPDKALWRGLASLLAVSAGGEGQAGAGRVDLRPGVIRWMSKMWEYLGQEDRAWPVSIRAQGMSYGKNDSVFKNGIDDGFGL